ncbi:hypothetical protein AAMO2058_000642800 [Amorphochlora amoebiformis]
MWERVKAFMEQGRQYLDGHISIGGTKRVPTYGEDRIRPVLPDAGYKVFKARYAAPWMPDPAWPYYRAALEYFYPETNSSLLDEMEALERIKLNNVKEAWKRFYALPSTRRLTMNTKPFNPDSDIWRDFQREFKHSDSDTSISLDPVQDNAWIFRSGSHHRGWYPHDEAFRKLERRRFEKMEIRLKRIADKIRSRNSSKLADFALYLEDQARRYSIIKMPPKVSEPMSQGELAAVGLRSSFLYSGDLLSKDQMKKLYPNYRPPRDMEGEDAETPTPPTPQSEEVGGMNSTEERDWIIDMEGAKAIERLPIKVNGTWVKPTSEQIVEEKRRFIIQKQQEEMEEKRELVKESEFVGEVYSNTTQGDLLKERLLRMFEAENDESGLPTMSKRKLKRKKELKDRRELDRSIKKERMPRTPQFDDFLLEYDRMMSENKRREYVNDPTVSVAERSVRRQETNPSRLS